MTPTDATMFKRCYTLLQESLSAPAGGASVAQVGEGLDTRLPFLDSVSARFGHGRGSGRQRRRRGRRGSGDGGSGTEEEEDEDEEEGEEEGEGEAGGANSRTGVTTRARTRRQRSGRRKRRRVLTVDTEAPPVDAPPPSAVSPMDLPQSPTRRARHSSLLLSLLSAAGATEGDGSAEGRDAPSSAADATGACPRVDPLL